MRYGTSTRLAPQVVLQKAEEYFGSLGLEVSSKNATSISWKGLKSFVTLHIYPGDESEVDIITMEWDSQSRSSFKGSVDMMTQFPFAKQKMTSLNEGDQIKVRIEDVGKQGDGIARVQGLVIFVAGAKPGEEVEVKIVRLGKNCAFAEKV